MSHGIPITSLMYFLLLNLLNNNIVENIKQVLIEHLGAMYNNKDCAFIVCGYISLDDEDYDTHTISLVIDGDVQLFLDTLDFEVDAYRKCLNGKIWYADGTWSEYHVDYDRCEGEWTRYVCPVIPEHCK
jgi:hypothetical protein